MAKNSPDEGKSTKMVEKQCYGCEKGSCQSQYRGRKSGQVLKGMDTRNQRRTACTGTVCRICHF